MATTLHATALVADFRAVTVFAALGPNPAPLAELIWALHRQRGLVAADLFLVMDGRGHHYLQQELSAPGLVLDDLRQRLGLSLGAERIHERIVHAPTGAALDDEDPAHADLYNAAIWETARAATAHAGPGIVVFGLASGRRRTMTAMSTMAFQLLARRQDICVDVRVTDKRAEGGSGFFFPEQAQQELTSREGKVFLARDVQVQLANVQLPRLRGLLTDDALATYAAALAAGQDAVDAVALPHVVVDLVKGEVRVDEAVLPLSFSEVMWFGALALARRDGEGWIAADQLGALQLVVAAGSAYAWSDAVKSNPLRALLGDTTVYKTAKDNSELLDDLAKLRSDTKKRIKAWCTKHRPSCSALLTPKDKRWRVDGTLAFHQRLPLEAARIQFLGLPAA